MDIRIINTKERIHQGLLHLLQTASINELTTSEILDAAEVSRKTFYTHYKDRQDLLREITDDIIAALKEAFEADRQVLTKLDHAPTRREIYTLAQKSFSKTVQTVDQYRDTLRILLSQHGDPRLIRRLHQIAVQEFLARAPFLFNPQTPPVTPAKLPVQIPMEYTIETYVGSLISLLIHWVRDPHPMSPAAMKATLGCVQVTTPFQLVYASAGKSSIQSATLGIAGLA